MKHTLQLFTLLLCATSFAQLEKLEMKYDSTHQCGDSGYHLIHSKGKTWLYDANSKSFKIEKSTHFIHYFEAPRVLMSLDPKTEMIQVYNFSDGFKLDTVCYRDARYYSSPVVDLIHVNTKEVNELDRAQLYYGLQKTGVFVIVQDLEHYIDYMEPIPLVDSNGEDSIITRADGVAEFVYADLSFPDVEKAGLYNLKSKQWVLPTQYANIEEVRPNLFIGVRAMDLNDEDLRYDFNYQFLEFDSKGNQTNAKLCKGQLDIPWELILKTENVAVQKRMENVIFKKEGKMGMVRLRLTWQYYNNDYSVSSVWEQKFHFKMDTAIFEKVDWMISLGGWKDGVYFSENGKIYLAGWQDSKDSYQRSFMVADSSLFYATDITGTLLPCLDWLEWGIDSIAVDETDGLGYAVYSKRDNSCEMQKKPSFGTLRLSDSTVYRQVYVEEYQSDIVLMSIYGDDSLDYNGFPVYAPAEPGFYESGVYDFKNNKWLVSPTNSWVIVAHKGYLCEYPLLDSNLNLIEMKYKFQNFDGSLAYEGISEEELKSKHLEDLIPKYKVDSVYSIGLTHEKYPEEKQFYFMSNGKIGVANIEESKIIMEPSDYSFYDYYQRFQLQMEDGVVSIDKEQGMKINLNDPTEQSWAIYSANINGGIAVVDLVKNKVHYLGGEGDPIEEQDLQDALQLEYIIASPILSFKKVGQNLIYFENNLSDYDDPDLPTYFDDSGEPMYYYDEYGSPIYETAKGYTRSGLYDLKSKKWVVPQKYYSIQAIEKDYSLWNYKQGDSSSLAFYCGSRWERSFKDLDDFFMNHEVIETILSITKADSFVPVYKKGGYDNSLFYQYYKVIQKGKVGIYNPSTLKLEIPYSDTVLFTPYQGFSLSISDGVIRVDESGKNGFEKVTKIAMDTVTKDGEVFKTSAEELICEIEKAGKYMILRYRSDLIQYPLIDSYGMDSISAEGEMVYIEPSELTDFCGVYDLESKKWVVSPQYNRVEKHWDGDYVFRVRTEHYGYLYVIYSSDFKLIAPSNPYEEVPEKYKDFIIEMMPK